MEGTINICEGKKFSDSDSVESELMTFIPSSLVDVRRHFLRASPARTMTGGTQDLKAFISIMGFTDGLP